VRMLIFASHLLQRCSSLQALSQKWESRAACAARSFHDFQTCGVRQL
jgi:hypothetical protein